MADEEIKEQTLGLNTDLPPDRLGQSAFSNTNLVPASVVSASPRHGTTLVGHYTLGSEGRALYVDTAPDRSDSAIIIVAVNRDSGGTSTIEGVYLHTQNVNEFGIVELDPADIGGTDWANGGDEARSAFIYGWVVVAADAGSPPDPLYARKVNVKTNAIAVTTYADDFGDGVLDTPVASAVCPIKRLDSTYRAYGVQALMLFRNANPDTTVLVGFYDLDDDAIIAKEVSVTASGVLPAALMNKYMAAGICPLQNGFNAFLFWYPTADADPPNCTIQAYVRANVDTALGNRRTVEETKALTSTDWIMDVCPFSNQTTMTFLMALGNTNAATAATGTITFGANPTASAQATGTITFADNPTADVDSITLNGIPWTFTTAASGTTNTQVKASLALTLTELAANLQASANASLTVATYTENGTVLTITYDAEGTNGNAYTLVASSDTVSGATLAGGVAGHTITINGVVFTYRTAENTSVDIVRDSTLSLTIDATFAKLNASVNASVDDATYAKSGTTILTITHDTAGTGGNAFTIAASNATASGATLSGGADDESHIKQYTLTLNTTGWPEDPTDDDLITFTDEWAGGIALTHASWLTRPDTCLAVQPTPAIAGLDQWIVALVGNYVTDTECPLISDPRLVLIDFDGVPTWTFEDGYGKATGMCLNQYGEIYVTATQDIMNGGNYLICRYDSRYEDFGETEARVLHGDNGLGDYAEDPDSARVMRPIWDGTYLTVQDHSPTSTYVYVYDRDLNFIRKYELATEDPSDGPRWRVSRFSSPWFGETY